jgi:hypothetical protein
MSLLKAVMVLSLFVAGCGGPLLSDQPGASTAGASANDGQSCVTKADCGGPQYVCAYPVADGCQAKGHCATVVAPCDAIREVCGCDGKPVETGDCFYAVGYASGPTTGARVCGDGGA